MIDAAIELLNSAGIEGATLKAIGEKAGYSRGLATHHFGNKAGLFRKVLREVSAIWVRELHNQVAGLTGLKALSVANAAHLQHILDRPDHLRAMYILWFGSLDPGSGFSPNLSRFMKKQRDSMAEWVRGGQELKEIRTDVDPVRMGEQLYANLIGINHQWLVDPSLDLTRAYRQMKQNTIQLLKV
jgi:AcrR family transcriptional regulator